MAIDTVKLVNYLAYGVQAKQAAAALGISVPRVTQLSQDERVKQLVDARKAEIAIEEAEKIASLRDARAALLGNIVELAKETESLSEAVRAYEILDKMARQEAVSEEADHTKTRGDRPDTVVVQIPIFVQQALEVEKNTANEIISVAGRSMATMTTSDTYKLLKEGRTIDGEDF